MHYIFYSKHSTKCKELNNLDEKGGEKKDGHGEVKLSKRVPNKREEKAQRHKHNNIDDDAHNLYNSKARWCC